MTTRSATTSIGTWAVLGVLGAVAFGVQGCSAPTIPGNEDLVLGDDTNGAKARGAQSADSPEGTQQGAIELGQGAPSTTPPPDADRTKGDPGANDAPPQCAVDAECNQTGRICAAGTCVKGCRSDAGCAAGESCDAGQCAPTNAAVECLADYDCEYGTICIASACIPGCYTSYDCPLGQGCTAGMCKATTTAGGAAVQCTSDGQCNPGLDGSGQICSAQGTCVAGCHRDNQCPGTKICVSGNCR
jgi:hypothetical protein